MINRAACCSAAEEPLLYADRRTAAPAASDEQGSNACAIVRPSGARLGALICMRPTSTESPAVIHCSANRAAAFALPAIRVTFLVLSCSAYGSKWLSLDATDRSTSTDTPTAHV